MRDRFRLLVERYVGVVFKRLRARRESEAKVVIDELVARFDERNRRGRLSDDDSETLSSLPAEEAGSGDAD